MDRHRARRNAISPFTSQALESRPSSPPRREAQTGVWAGRLTFRATGFTAAKIEIDGSQDGITFAAIDSTLVQEGVNPTNWTSATVSNTIVVRAYSPFIQVNLVSVTGSGSLNTLMLGYVGTSAQSDAGNTVGGITALTGDVSATGPGSVPATVQGIEGTPFCTGFIPVQGSLVQYTINSAPNPCWEEVPPNTSGIQKFLSQTGLSGVAGRGKLATRAQRSSADVLFDEYGFGCCHLFAANHVAL